jgi:hypothetical protein
VKFLKKYNISLELNNFNYSKILFKYISLLKLYFDVDHLLKTDLNANLMYLYLSKYIASMAIINIIVKYVFSYEKLQYFLV